MTSYNYLVDNVSKTRESDDLAAELLTRLSVSHLEYEYITHLTDIVFNYNNNQSLTNIPHAVK